MFNGGHLGPYRSPCAGILAPDSTPFRSFAPTLWRLLPALGLAPVRVLADVLTWCRHQRGIDGLPATGDIAIALQPGIHALQRCCSTLNNDALGKAPDGVAVGDVHGVLQQAKALVTHAVKQLVLHLLVREVVQALQDQHAHHHFGGVGRPSALAGVGPCEKTIHQRSQFCEVDVLGDDLQRVAHLVDL